MNRTLYAEDCLNVLNDPHKLPDDSVDLIYLDPPFDSDERYNLPFRSKDRSLKPVEAFEDIWDWTADDVSLLGELDENLQTRPLATIVRFAREMEESPQKRRRGRQPSLAAYLLNMALRLKAMSRVLKPNGSIYLHCDPKARFC